MTKIVNFDTLTIENFLSIGKEPVTINFGPGLHIITGSNKDQSDRRNAVGKSTILDGLSFVLFGSTMRELKKEFIINNITKKTSRVSLTFTIKENNKINRYELHRTLDPSKCFLYENGIDVTRDSMVNTTEYVQNILKLTPEIFQNCIAMTLNNMVPFMAKKKIEKRKFIESIFNLEIFSEMNSNLKVEMLEARKDLDNKNFKYDEIKTYVDTLTKQNETKLKDKEERKTTLIKRKEENEKSLTQINNKLSKIQTLNLNSVEEKIKMAEVKSEEIISKINLLGKEITSLETKRDIVNSNMLKIGTDKDSCPICLKPVTEDDKSHIKKEKGILKKEINEYDSKIKNLEEKLSVYEESKIKINTAVIKLKDIVNAQKLQNEQKKHLLQKQKDLLNYNSTIEKDLVDLEKKEEDNTAIINSYIEKLNNALIELELIKKTINIYDLVKFVLSEDGVRSYIVKKILTLFNNKLSLYLRRLNSVAFIKFNEFFEETIVNSKGVEMSYFNFSGAEKKVIDLAIMFTFIEMLRMQNNVIYNIQFYDELLDTSLDEAGVELAVQLLTELTREYSYGIYVISHRKECSKLSTGEVIFLQKRDGITKRIPFIV